MCPSFVLRVVTTALQNSRLLYRLPHVLSLLWLLLSRRTHTVTSWLKNPLFNLRVDCFIILIYRHVIIDTIWLIIRYDTLPILIFARVLHYFNTRGSFHNFYGPLKSFVKLRSLFLILSLRANHIGDVHVRRTRCSVPWAVLSALTGSPMAVFKLRCWTFKIRWDLIQNLFWLKYGDWCLHILPLSWLLVRILKWIIDIIWPFSMPLTLVSVLNDPVNKYFWCLLEN